MDTSYLAEVLAADPFAAKFAKLNAAIAELVRGGRPPSVFLSFSLFLLVATAISNSIGC
jgi:hypothetical protein